jgi:hypothetical protein
MNAADLFHPPGAVAGPATPRRPKRLRLLIACGALVFAAGTALTLLWPRLTKPSQADAGLTMEQARVEARRTLVSFLSATTVEQRAQWVIGGQEALPLMQAYYAGREVETLAAEGFQPVSWDFSQEAPDRVAFELARGRSLSTAVACLKKDGSGRWLMDWEIWTQSLDGRFRDFIARPAEGEHTLRVRLTSLAGSEEGVKLEVADPFNAGNRLTFDVIRPDLTALYLADLPAGVCRTATVQLVWLNDGLTGTLQAALRRHICWGFQNIDGVEAAEREPARARKHHPPMPESSRSEVAVAGPVAPIVEAVETALTTASSADPGPATQVKVTPSRRTARK